MLYDVLIVGGGPAGLSAALNLGRARRRVLLCDAGERRNAAAERIHGFLTRDGTPPAEFRTIGKQQLEPYTSVEVRGEPVLGIERASDRFLVRLRSERVEARRILLCTGLVDQLPQLEGLRELWGGSVFQCPYCHGWEHQNERFGYLALSADRISFPLLLRGWTSHVTLFTNARLEVPAELREAFASAGVAVEERPISRLTSHNGRLESVELTDAARTDCDVLFVHPPQAQVDLVRSLGLALTAAGYVQVDEMRRETSVPGIYAGGDLVSPLQSAILAAASGMSAAGALNHGLMAELAIQRLLP